MTMKMNYVNMTGAGAIAFLHGFGIGLPIACDSDFTVDVG